MTKLDELDCIESVVTDQPEGYPTYARVYATVASSKRDDREVDLAAQLALQLEQQVAELRGFITERNIEKDRKALHAAAWMKKQILDLVKDLEPDCATDQPLMEGLKAIANLEGFDG